MKFMKKSNMTSMKKNLEMIFDLRQVVIQEEILREAMRNLSLSKKKDLKQTLERKLIGIKNQGKNHHMMNMKKIFLLKKDNPLKIFPSS